MSIEKMFDLSGKVAIVTGRHSGLGKGIAEGLAEAGADIVICARRLELCQEACSEIEKELRVKSLPIKCDMTKTDEVNNLVETTTKEFGKVDILVNSAGIGDMEFICENAAIKDSITDGKDLHLFQYVAKGLAVFFMQGGMI